MQKAKDLLIGNTFPFALMRRDADIRVSSFEALRQVATEATIHSFWGHAGTLAAAETEVGFSLRPKVDRPALMLTDDLPTLDGIVFKTCWILAPDYQPGFRPAIGTEVAAGQIKGWHVLRIDWR